MDRILVVGGAGYIGSVLVRHLLQAGYEIRVLDQLLFGEHSIRDLLGRRRFQLVEGDFRDGQRVAEAAEGVDALIHLGAIVGDPACRIDESATLQTNYTATSLLARLCKENGISRMLFASTCSVYGSSDALVDENSALRPLSLYSQTKTDSEKVLLASRDRSFHPTILRIGTVFGWSPRPRFDLAVNLLAARAYFEQRFVIYNQRQWRPFIHVSDVARAFRLVLEARLSLASGQVFNVGSNEMNCRLGQVGEEIRQLTPTVRILNESNSDARSYRVCFDKIERTLNFRSTNSLRSGVAEIYSALARGWVKDPASAVYHNHKLLELEGKPLNKPLTTLPAAAGGIAPSNIGVRLRPAPVGA